MALTLEKNKLLAPLTTFGIGGMAAEFVEVRTEDELREAVRYGNSRQLPITILAGGSNVLVPNDGLKGIVIRLTGDDHSFAGTELSAFAGCNLLSLIREASGRGLGGWEKLSGIPGSVGGAIRGNAGAFGTEIKDFAAKVRALDMENGDLREFSNTACDFDYRHSFFKDNREWVITQVFLQLKKVDVAGSARLTQETIAEREKRHLQNVRAAGSFFMNPVAPKEVVAMFEKEKNMQSREGRVPAGWLIEKAGMKGATVGGAVASEQHPNYIVNKGHATSYDVLRLAEKIHDAVKKEFGVELHEEAAIL